MKTFLHISSKYGRGGVGNAVKRMHFNLIDNNHNSIIINDVNDDKKNNIYKINNILNSLLIKIKYQIFTYFKFFDKKYFYNNYNNYFSISSNKIYKIINQNVDYIILHSIQNYCSFKTIYNLKNIYNAKVFLYIYDCEFFTGGCHYNLDCDKYLLDCNNCNAINKSSKKNASILFSYKNKYYKKINPEIISNSSYLSNKSKKSKLLEKYNNFVLPVTIDNKIFYRFKNKKFNNKKIKLLYATPNLQSFIKGFDNLSNIFNKLNKNIIKNYQLITLGNKNFNKISNIDHKHIDFVNTDSELLQIYNEVDFFLMTSNIEESNSTMLMEAMFCGVPFISFNVGNVKFFEANKAGFIIDNNNYEKYINTLNNLVNLSEKKYKIMSDQCIYYSEKFFGFESQFLKIKKNIIK